MRRRRSPLGRLWVVASGVALGVLATWVAGPPLLGRLAVFRLRQVELVGVRHLSPDAVIAALRLDERASVFADLGLLGDRVKGLAGVADARIVRRWPATLKVIVREVEPAAFVTGPRGLVVVDAGGRPLPFDPTRSGLDLPIAAGGDSAVAGVLARVQAVDPALFREITAARASVRGDVLLELGSRRVLVAPDVGPEVIRAVVLVAQDWAARARPYAELDARYAGQVVVRRAQGTARRDGAATAAAADRGARGRRAGRTGGG